jgi:hypothetical protein
MQPRRSRGRVDRSLDYWTVTVVRIHGWMQHWTLNVPLVLIAPLAPVVTLMPVPDLMST